LALLQEAKEFFDEVFLLPFKIEHLKEEGYCILQPTSAAV